MNLRINENPLTKNSTKKTKSIHPPPLAPKPKNLLICYFIEVDTQGGYKMTQMEMGIWDFIINTRNSFRQLVLGEYKVRQQHKSFEQALEKVEKALNELASAWNNEVVDAQEKVRKKFTGKFRTYEEAIPHLREEIPLFFTRCVITKHWYSKEIMKGFSPASDEDAYKTASAWLRGCLAK